MELTGLRKKEIYRKVFARYTTRVRTLTTIAHLAIHTQPQIV
jgi:hypothetical protein